MQWIKCSERLPENDGPYLVYYPAIGRPDNYSVQHWDNVEQSFSNTRIYDVNDKLVAITHWMPLPEPPEEE